MENTKVLLEVLRGRIERNRNDPEPHPGGQPRRWERKGRLTTFEDTDPVEQALWLQDPTPELPRSCLRERDNSGGQFAILRDISGSMTGMQARWAASLVLDLMELARDKKMRVGYCEFNHEAHMKYVNGRFFNRIHGDQKTEMTLLAKSVKCSGFTNYEAPLAEVMEQFAIHQGGPTHSYGRGSSPNRHILFLTDGIPTQGSTSTILEQLEKDHLGVAVHTVFIGIGDDYPKALDQIAELTGGTQFQAVPRKGSVHVFLRGDETYQDVVKDRLAAVNSGLSYKEKPNIATPQRSDGKGHPGVTGYRFV